MRRLVATASVLAMLIASAPVASAQLSAVPICSFTGSISPGTSIEKSCIAASPVFADTTVSTYVDQSSIRVFDERDRVVTGPDRDTFIGFFRLSLSTQRILTSGDPANETTDPDVAPQPRAAAPFRPTCVDRKLTELTGVSPGSDATSCRVGRVRAAGTPYFTREYVEKLTMLDTGDQTKYAGWGIQFDEFERYYTPALRDCGVAWACESRGLSLYER
ncbi:MAG TPA: hypothetical protein VNE62_11665 [Actinomycetota bacterium]|nr:hypothetical protein [Actinomycetota bacterium]